MSHEWFLKFLLCNSLVFSTTKTINIIVFHSFETFFINWWWKFMQQMNPFFSLGSLLLLQDFLSSSLLQTHRTLSDHPAKPKNIDWWTYYLLQQQQQTKRNSTSGSGKDSVSQPYPYLVKVEVVSDRPSVQENIVKLKEKKEWMCIGMCIFSCFDLHDQCQLHQWFPSNHFRHSYQILAELALALLLIYIWRKMTSTY